MRSTSKNGAGVWQNVQKQVRFGDGMRRNRRIFDMLLRGYVCLGILAVAPPAATETSAPPTGIYFQAHRGGMDEVPENTLTAVRHAWGIPGAVPEIDLRTTEDGVIVVIHDATPARTTDAPEEERERPISELRLEELLQWDAGSWFDPAYAGERVPTLEEVFKEMQARPGARIYLDLKDVDLDALQALIEAHALLERILFVHGSQEMCVKLQERFPGTTTMTWISGGPEQIRPRFEELEASGFAGISQLQFHLRAEETDTGIAYALDEAFLRDAVARTRTHGVELQLRPFLFDADSLRPLLALGVRWYVADAPHAFAEALAAAAALEAAPAR